MLLGEGELITGIKTVQGRSLSVDVPMYCNLKNSQWLGQKQNTGFHLDISEHVCAPDHC